MHIFLIKLEVVELNIYNEERNQKKNNIIEKDTKLLLEVEKQLREYFEGKRFGAVPVISDQEGTPRVQEKENLPAEGTVKALEQLLLEMRQTLGDLFQSGLDSVQEESMSQLRRLEKESEEMGLHGGSEELSRIRTALEQKAHQMQFDSEPVILAWGRLMEYLGACLEKTSFDQALIRMEDT